MTATLGAATTTGATTRLPRRRGRLKRVPPVIWAFLILPFAFEIALVFWPAVNSFYIALTKWNGAGAPEFIGLKNFANLATDPVFGQALGNTVIWMVGFGGASIVIGLCLAVALNKPRRFVGLYRGAIYLPMVFSLAVTGLFWRLLYQPEGAVNTVLGSIGLGSLEQQWLADPNTALYAVLIAAVWRQCGYIMVLYLAGLKGIDPTLEEAAAVDGATRWQRFWRIVMPQLRGVNTVVIAVTVIDSLRTFDIVWAMTRGGPYNSTQLLSTYMYQTSFSTVDLGYGSAIAVVIFLLAVVFIIGYLVRASREED
ncbi:carbohydrate ABC transporter permease [Amnibacterium kyonggiense]|uniref:Carbohydrate ABC transporter membrane protein 1 (CUT1 family) n=1 Tax=Amnibacterium kyonggiense TaxID=595671 RepID=A0A4R7FI08_9MICO|nr:sugar ABC transporter permease [Amnibacterium kyonggiense]TDS76104.1 carbohydrate ABC transporter membrane protein 1 (CUT1 family) [Amnibacterium kyonggiense]